MGGHPSVGPRVWRADLTCVRAVFDGRSGRSTWPFRPPTSKNLRYLAKQGERHPALKMSEWPFEHIENTRNLFESTFSPRSVTALLRPRMGGKGQLPLSELADTVLGTGD